MISSSHGVKIQNIIAHSKLGVTVDINEVATALHGRVNKELFPAAVGHCRETGTTPSIFESGKLVVVGAYTEDRALLGSYIFADTLRREMHIKVNIYNFDINNVVGCFSVGVPLNLDLFVEDHGLTAQWDPDNFKGLCYKPKGCVSFVLFESGKVIVTGGKTTKDLHDAYATHIDDIKKYQKGAEYREQDVGISRSRAWIQPKTAIKNKYKRKLSVPKQ